MSSELYLIDHFANNGASRFHGMSATAKLLFAASYLLMIVFSRNVIVLLLFLLINVLLILLSGTNLRLSAKLSVYPVFFAAIFAISQLPDYNLALVTLLKAAASATLMIWLITTTKYSLVFKAIEKISPLLSTVFMLTYRILFMTAEEIQTAAEMMKMRGHAVAKPGRKIENIGNLCGMVFVKTTDEAEKMYEIMKIRGFDGKIRTLADREFAPKAADLLLAPVLGCAALLFMVLR